MFRGWIVLGCALGACGSVKGGGDVDAGATGVDFSISTRPRLDARVPDAAIVEVSLERRSGFEGEVVIELSGLPVGVTAGPVTIAAGADAAEVMLDTSGGEPGALSDVTVTGAAGDVTREAGFELFLAGPTGSRDVTFGVEGVAASPTGLDQPIIGDVVALSDGRVLVGGSAGGNLFVVAYLPDGSIDSDFGAGGVVEIDASGSGVPSTSGGELAVQSDGKIIVAGFGFAEGTQNRDVVLARLLPGGGLDSTFAGSGLVVHAYSDLDVQEDAIAVGPGDVIGMAGTRIVVSGQDDRVAAGRFTAAGAIDTDFDGGLASVQIGARSFGRAVAFQSDGKLVIGASSSTLLRFLTDGTLDATFGTEGQLSLPDPPRALVVLDSNDLLVTAGFSLFRFDANGAADAGFGDGGAFTAPGTAPFLQSIAVTAGGDVIAAGADSNEQFLLRVTGEGTIDRSFGDEGVAPDPSAAGLSPKIALRTPFRLVVLRQLQQPFGLELIQYWY